MSKCWEKKSPLKIALTLVLLVTIDMLLLLITIYVLCSMKKKDSSCEAICREANHLRSLIDLLREGSIYSQALDYNEDLTNLIIKSKDNIDSSPRLINEVYDKLLENEALVEELLGKYPVETNLKTLNASFSNTSFIIQNFQDSSDVEQKKKMRQMYFCPEDVRGSTSAPFVVAIVQVLYNSDDFLNNLKYLCSGSIISKYWVLSSSECFDHEASVKKYIENSLIRAGSSYWCKEGVLHEVDQIVRPPTQLRTTMIYSLLAFRTKDPFMNLPSIQSVRLAKRSTLNEGRYVETYHWSAEPALKYKYRKKHVPLDRKHVHIYNEGDCLTILDSKDFFCLQELNPSGFCTYMWGAPVLKNYTLVGVHIHASCMEMEGRSVHHFEDVAPYRFWLKNLEK